MIAKLQGLVWDILDSSLIVNVGNVGYSVLCPAPIVQNVQINDDITLYIHTVVREDGWTLYGFHTLVDKDFFVKLTTISGVGGKVGLALFNQLGGEGIIRALQQEDKAMLIRVTGVGPRLAARLITEFKDKLPPIQTQDIKIPADNEPVKATIVNALLKLGFNRAEIIPQLQRVLGKFPNESVEVLLRETLKNLG